MPNKQVSDLCEPGVRYAPVVLDTAFGEVARGLFIGVAGNATVVDEAGTAVLFKGLAAGSILSVRCKQVNTTNTTATDMVAIF